MGEGRGRERGERERERQRERRRVNPPLFRIITINISLVVVTWPPSLLEEVDPPIREEHRELPLDFLPCDQRAEGEDHCWLTGATTTSPW